MTIVFMATLRLADRLKVTIWVVDSFWQRKSRNFWLWVERNLC